MNLWFKSKQDHAIADIKTYFDETVEKFIKFTSFINSFSGIQKNYSQALG